MENSYHNRDFERYLKQNADQYRMFPSEKVWKNIHGALHTRRRWYGIGLALLLLTTAAVTGVMLMPGNKSTGGIAKIYGIKAGTAISQLKTSETNTTDQPIQPSFTETFTRKRQTVQPVSNDPVDNGSIVAYNEPEITTHTDASVQNRSSRINNTSEIVAVQPVIKVS